LATSIGLVNKIFLVESYIIENLIGVDNVTYITLNYFYVNVLLPSNLCQYCLDKIEKVILGGISYNNIA
jgi:hypothetical protein